MIDPASSLPIEEVDGACRVMAKAPLADDHEPRLLVDVDATGPLGVQVQVVDPSAGRASTGCELLHAVLLVTR